MIDPQSRPVVIFGIGELAQLAHFYFTHDSRRAVAGFAVDAKYLDPTEFLGLPVIAYEALEFEFSAQPIRLVRCNWLFEPELHSSRALCRGALARLPVGELRQFAGVGVA